MYSFEAVETHLRMCSAIAASIPGTVGFALHSDSADARPTTQHRMGRVKLPPQNTRTAPAIAELSLLRQIRRTEVFFWKRAR